MPIVIDPKSKQLNKNLELAKRFNSNFVVVDPVDSGRNVAAPVSMESLARFVLLARAFIEKPSKRLFFGKGFSHEEATAKLKSFMKSTGFHFFLMVTKLPEKSEDITWPQLRKTAEIISDFASIYGDILFSIEQNRFASAEELLRFVTRGGLKKRRKDIALKGAKLYVDKVPEDLVDVVYDGLRKKFLNL